MLWTIVQSLMFALSGALLFAPLWGRRTRRLLELKREECDGWRKTANEALDACKSISRTCREWEQCAEVWRSEAIKRMPQGWRPN